MEYKNVLLLTLFALGFAFLSVLYLDAPLAYYFHNNHLAIFKSITELGNAFYYLVGFLGLFLWFRYKEKLDKAVEMLYLFFSVFLSGVLVAIPKILIGRPRPKLFFQGESFYPQWLEFKGSLWSMPSGHSATAFAVGVGLALLYPRYRWFFIALAALVAISRVVLTKHYLSDIIVGALIGGLTSWWLYRKVFNGTKARSGY
ncbi:MAG: phosphatase PAP2 family protein [Epsilonproteobacteria bacterium]|nr:phosphatase PAP2 family protein [Campylobacterota bacterium]